MDSTATIRRRPLGVKGRSLGGRPRTHARPGWVVAGSSPVAAALLLMWLFERKSRYEEVLLCRTYPAYADDAAGTRRFVPFVYRAPAGAEHPAARPRAALGWERCGFDLEVPSVHRDVETGAADRGGPRVSTG